MSDDLNQFADLFIEETNLNESVKRIACTLRPEWSDKELMIRELSGGITNRLVGCYPAHLGSFDTEETILFRVYGKNTELFISRSDEITTMQLMKQIGLGPKYYCSFKNGISYEYLPGAILDERLVRDDNVYPKVAQATATMHLLNFDDSSHHEPFIFNKIRDLLDLVKPDYKANMSHMTDDLLARVPSLSQLKQEFQFLESHLLNYTRANKSLIVFSHNDLLLGNIVYNKRQNVVKFIDYEYGAFNYQAYDVANHFNEFAGVEKPDYSLFPDKEFQLNWLRVYLESFYTRLNKYYLKQNDSALIVDDEKLTQFYCEVNKFTLASHLMWGVWSLVQAQSSNLEFNFVDYARIRLDEYYKRKLQVIDLC